VNTPLTLALGLVVGFSTLAFSQANKSPDVRAMADAVNEHYNHLRSLQTEFTETYRGNAIDRTESGTLWLKKPRKMRWQYRSPKEKLFVSDGKEVWFYVPSERQARKESFRKLEDLRSPLALLLGKTKLEKELKGLSLAPDVAPLNPGDFMLRGIPQGMESTVDQVVLEITPDHEISRIILYQTDGSTTEYRFSAQKQNPPVADDRFRFTPPPGVETIEGNLGQ
jgi:outer membrane lipoprotein carrier protein